MAYVLDATAIRSGMTFAGDQWFTTQCVANEIRLGRQGRGMDLLADLAITVQGPSPESLDRIRMAAESTGDIAKLSETDIEVLALALEKDAILISDDYSVQNVAALLKIQFQTDLGGIREIIHWTFRCRGCGRYFDEQHPDCPVCGSEIRQVKKK